MKVHVYKNLVRGDWSIRLNGKVIGHEREVWLKDVEFYVSAKARERVCRNKCREVHAWAIGELVGAPAIALKRESITYNPYRSGSFTFRDGKPIERAQYVHFSVSEGAFAVTKQ